jgi:hypothetical protein
MPKKNLTSILAILLIVLLVVLIIIDKSSSKNSENNPSTEENQKEEIIEDNQEMLMSTEKQEAVVKYLNENISILSPEKEVLGGTFYITSIDFLDDNNLIVGYEDGHIALIAEVEYEYLDADNIVINKFNIVSE